MNKRYDPSLMYTWTPEDKFEMTGEQFGIVLNAIRGILATPEAARILMLDKANAAIESMMAKAVEEGTVVETTQPVPSKDKLRIVN